MKKIILTGSNGFVGRNLIKSLSSSYDFIKFNFENKIKLNAFAIIHLAGLAHDLNNTRDRHDYYKINTNLTIELFDEFLISNVELFIFFSSVKSVADEVKGILTEDFYPDPKTDYGKSKLLAEKYILSKTLPPGKKVFILRPCMIHGPENKGNLNILFNFAIKRYPWPLGAYSNSRSFCSIDNLIFILSELIENNNIESGVYNISDDEPISTNDLIKLIANHQNKSAKIWHVPKSFINLIVSFGDFLELPLNSRNLSKLTASYVVSNHKIKKAINKNLPFTTTEGFIKTFNSFKEKYKII